LKICCIKDATNALAVERRAEHSGRKRLVPRNPTRNSRRLEFTFIRAHFLLLQPVFPYGHRKAWPARRDFPQEKKVWPAVQHLPKR
jgi:hypothetical protein